ncbi:MAG: cytochrome c biogenesis protein DipZ [bacterium]|nr:cytochrome c biogenesis protein DipZ [bacterium]
MILLAISFIAGLLTVLAPCTLPLLPVIVGGSISGKPNIWRTLVMIGSLGVSVFLFTFILKAGTTFINVPSSVWQWMSGGLLLIFGLITLFPVLWDRLSFVNALNRRSNRLLAQGNTRGGVVGDVIIGAALGPVFSSCSPTYFIVLATVLPVHPAEGMLYLLAYCIGLALSLFAVAIAGQKIVNALGIASNPYGWFKRIIGVLFILIGIAIITGYDKTVELYLISHAGIFDVTQIEQRLLQAQDSGQKPSLQSGTTSAEFLTPAQKVAFYPKGPEFMGIDGYLNTNGQSIKLSQFKGKNVVLIDFWTYSCINCLRTIPYLNVWYQKYKDNGLVIIGVHTPEFAFEHVQQNVADALVRLGITYPVVLDNKYATWNAFGNRYWPHEYLIDIDGYIVHDHIGEGEYDRTEKAIQTALIERVARLNTNTQVASSTVDVVSPNLSGVQSPETYFGSLRNEYLGNGTQGTNGLQNLTIPQDIQPHTLYLDGTWDIKPQYAESQGVANIQYFYSSGDVYLVASASTPVVIKVLRDGKPVGSFAGSDVDPTTSTATIQTDRLYRLVHDATPGPHTIQIKVKGAGLKAYTFTFG